MATPYRRVLRWASARRSPKRAAATSACPAGGSTCRAIAALPLRIARSTTPRSASTRSSLSAAYGHWCSPRGPRRIHNPCAFDTNKTPPGRSDAVSSSRQRGSAAEGTWKRQALAKMPSYAARGRSSCVRSCCMTSQPESCLAISQKAGTPSRPTARWPILVKATRSRPLAQQTSRMSSGTGRSASGARSDCMFCVTS